MSWKNAVVTAMFVMERFTEEVTVTVDVETPQLFTAEAQLIERKKATVISDNL
jgi:hypothetical protein